MPNGHGQGLSLLSENSVSPWWFSDRTQLSFVDHVSSFLPKNTNSRKWLVKSFVSWSQSEDLYFVVGQWLWRSGPWALLSDRPALRLHCFPAAVEVKSGVKLRNLPASPSARLTLCDPVDSTRQASLSIEFSRQEDWSGQPVPSPGDLPAQGSNLGLLRCRRILYCLSHQRRPSGYRDLSKFHVKISVPSSLKWE